MIGHGHVLKTCPLSPQLLQNIVISTLPSSKLLFRFKQMSSQSRLSPTACVIAFKVVNLTTTYSASNVAITQAGSGYLVGESFKILGVQLGGAAATNDLTLNVASTDINGGILTFSGYTGTAIGTSALDGLVFNVPLPVTGSFNYSYTRDASDVTRKLKERLIYNEKMAGTTITPGSASLVTGRPGVTPAGVNHLPAGNAEIAWIPLSNQYRLSYLFGKLNCLTGVGGAFNLNGPNSYNPATGAKEGS